MGKGTGLLAFEYPNGSIWQVRRTSIEFWRNICSTIMALRSFQGCRFKGLAGDPIGSIGPLLTPVKGKVVSEEDTLIYWSLNISCGWYLWWGLTLLALIRGVSLGNTE